MMYKKMVTMIMVFTLSLCRAQENLCKIFHHKTNDTACSLERAKIVLYFSKAPVVTVLSDEQQGNKNIITFFFPKITIADRACREMVNRINSNPTQSYSITVEQVQQPTDGIRLAIVYDPKKISFTNQEPSRITHYGEFESIGTQEGILFTLYNKEYIDALKEKSAPILRTASHNVPTHIVIDCGHGGHDCGTKGVCSVYEKDITRAVGDVVADELKKKDLAFLLRA